MTEITYLGENLFIGNLGHAFVSVALVAALLASIFYLRNEITQNPAERKLGRLFFLFIQQP
jgi:uncharacterized membrane protein YciS (DUF1049 family)